MILLFFLIFPFCKIIDKTLKNKKLQKISCNDTILTINNIEILPDNIVWSDDGSFYVLAFEPNQVHFIFNPTCGYWFPSKIINNEIIFYWELNPDCVFDRGLEIKYLNIENPEIGKPFGKIKMINDTTLYISYFYQEWVKKINEYEKESIDTLFPSVFRKIIW